MEGRRSLVVAMIPPDAPPALSYGHLVLRAALRPIVRAVLRTPGAVSPLYVRGERIEEAVTAEVDSAGRRLRLPGRTVEEVVRLQGRGRGVVVCAIGEATALVPLRSLLPQDLQVVIWGATAVRSCPETVRSWIQGGLDVDSASLLGRNPTSALADALDAINPAERRAVVWVGTSGSNARREAEAELRLLARGHRRVRRLQLPGDGKAEAPTSDGAIVALVTAADVRRSQPDRLRGWLAGLRGAPVVLVTDLTAAGALQERLGPEWPSLTRVVHEIPPSEPGGWPALEDVLLEPPEIAQPVEGASTFHLAEMSLADVLQSIETWQRSGVLIVFTDERLGWIEVVGDEIQRCGYLGGSHRRLAAVRTMARWRNARALLIPSLPDLPGAAGAERLGLGAIAFDLMTVGALEPVDDASPRVGGLAVALWLLRFGLRGEAEAALRAVVEGGKPGAEEMFVLAHLLVRRDPAATQWFHWAAASDAWRDDTAGLRDSADLNALLLEVRAGRLAASSASSVVQDWLTSGGAGALPGHGHLALCAELAARAAATDPEHRLTA